MRTWTLQSVPNARKLTYVSLHLSSLGLDCGKSRIAGRIGNGGSKDPADRGTAIPQRAGRGRKAAWRDHRRCGQGVVGAGPGGSILPAVRRQDGEDRGAV